jgi:hypothetical protein
MNQLMILHVECHFIRMYAEFSDSAVRQYSLRLKNGYSNAVCDTPGSQGTLSEQLFCIPNLFLAPTCMPPITVAARSKT